MNLARSLPSSLPRRFRRAHRAQLRLASASIEVVVADRFMVRLRGLAGLGAEKLVPLAFPRCRSLHTFRMRVPIDVVWIDPDAGRVLGVEPDVGRRRIVRAPRGSGRGTAAIELPAGDAGALGIHEDADLRIDRE